MFWPPSSLNIVFILTYELNDPINEFSDYATGHKQQTTKQLSWNYGMLWIAENAKKKLKKYPQV